MNKRTRSNALTVLQIAEIMGFSEIAAELKAFQQHGARGVKRPASSTPDLAGNKKPRIEHDKKSGYDWSTILPTLADGIETFFVKPSLYHRLKNLSKNTQNEMGIASIEKIKNTSLHRLTLSDAEKYQRFLQQPINANKATEPPVNLYTNGLNQSHAFFENSKQQVSNPPVTRTPQLN